MSNEASLRFDVEKVENESFQKINQEFFDRVSKIFFWKVMIEIGLQIQGFSEVILDSLKEAIGCTSFYLNPIKLIFRHYHLLMSLSFCQ